MDTDIPTPTDYGQPLPPYFQDKDTREIISVINNNPSNALSKAIIEEKKIRDEQEEGYLRDIKNFQKGKDVLETSEMKKKLFDDYLERTLIKNIAKRDLIKKGVTVKGGKYYKRRRSKRRTSRKSKKRRATKKRH